MALWRLREGEGRMNITITEAELFEQLGRMYAENQKLRRQLEQMSKPEVNSG